MMITKFQTALLVLLAVAGSLGIASMRYRRQPVTVSRGCFHQVARHVTGCASITSNADGALAVEVTGLRIANTPNLELVLSTAHDAFENEAVKQAKQLSLGPVDARAEYQVFRIPQDADISEFHSLTIWNTKYQVNFATAPLR